MEPDVKPSPAKRRYDATRRRAAAAETRRTIVAAARRLFLQRGYAATTMPAIAAAAEVALDTVYATVGPKPALFRHLIELALSGEDQPVPAEARDYVQAIRAEPDPRRKLARYARAVCEIHPRLAPLVVVLREAARGEPELAALWAEIAERRARNMRLFVADVAAAGGLRAGVTVDEAADLVWATNAPEFYLLLVDERGWDPERFERWLAELWIRMLLP
ncbi:MAG: TetR family transcriptional regulator [Chloroflexota bacterium]|nr:TetR family transcriptional regulator [Chloroflexota bacterium]